MSSPESEKVQQMVVGPGGLLTLTLQELIRQLERIKETVDPDAPVAHIEFGGLAPIKGVSVQNQAVVIH